MEVHGTPGRIHMTQETYELLKDEFVCEPRGTVTVKGKGDMETWYLVGSRTSSIASVAAERVGAEPVVVRSTPTEAATPDGGRSSLVEGL
jgi:hypothetical protein